MRHRWYLVLLPFLLAAPLAAQDTGVPRPERWRAAPREPAPLFRLGLKPLGPVFPIELGEAPRLPPPWDGPVGRRAAEWAAATQARLAPRWTTWPTAPPAETRRTARKAADLLPDALAGVADLGMRVFGRGELGGDWTRYRPCDPALRLNCNPTLFPLLTPDIQFGVQVRGTISDRLHIDVDYDQRREFDAANNINVYYQGFAGEVLQRVEVGDVAFELPPSRYLTEGIPGGNFGFKATGRIGALDVQAIWAQQKGDVATREFRLEGAGGARGLVQEARLALDDADYVRGQFFFLVDPAALSGYPHVNVLALRAADAPPELRPAAAAAGIQVYRDERPSLTNPQEQAQLGYFLADAVAADGTLRHSGRFRRLVPGEDYLVHPSGLWLMLRAPLRPDEALAVAYATEAGGTVGTLDAERAPAGTVPELRLLRGPATIHQPGQATWPYELHQVYRVDASSGVEPGSVTLKISLGELAAGATHLDAAGQSLSYLKLFGLDEDAPFEAVDEAQLFQPGRELLGDAGGAGRFGGTFLVFPTLQPFAEPPPLPSVGLSAADALAALGADANREIYEEPDPVLREGSARFRLNFEYRVRVDGLVSSFDLGALGIREGSERITIDGRPLRRGVDYTIDYALGTVTLTNPQAVLGANPDAVIEATWEQKAAFEIAPTSIYGLNARYDLGAVGRIDLVGLYQTEKAIVNRPQLGLEPGAIFLGGASGDLDFRAGWLDALLDRIPALDDSVPSGIRLAGELGVSAPDPNRRGDTYLDDFEATDEVPLGLDRGLWRLGSRPADPVGATDVLPIPLDISTAAPLVWQHDLLDASGRVVGPLLAREIDRQINVAGAERTEPVLYLSFGDAASATGERRWRSMTTVLETTGRDMTRSEYLEFYAASPQGLDLALVIDIGTVSEDAFYIAPDGRTAGVYANGRPWGLGTLDEEARIAEREIWGPDLDALGLWDQPCRAEPGQQSYPLGDPRANCARGNGRLDTEDLDGNGILDAADGAYFRYVVRLAGASPYLVRDRAETGTEFRLYRIPLRGPGAIPVGGATEGTWRYVKHLRITVAGPAFATPGDITLARMRVVGSRWAKRDVDGIRAGLVEDRPGAGVATTDFHVGPVSRITDGDAYAPPPGVGDQLQDPSSAYGGSAVEYNEKSLGLTYRGLAPGDRAEAYYRYPQQPRNFLSYRELRLWAVPRGGRWGAPDGERLVVSVGTDARNRYLFVTPLRAAPAAGVRPEDWLPEVAIDFRRWFELKAEAERRLIEGGAAPGEPVVVWSPDSTYAVVMEDRARAPNLAAVREIGFAVYNPGGVPVDGAVWLDELRLAGAVTEPGIAGHVALDVRAGGFATASIAYANEGARFRRLNDTPGYQAARDLSVGGTIQLGRLAPDAWGLEAPVSFSYTRSGLEPMFLQQSDVRADQLPGLRETGATRTHIGFALRRTEPSGNAIAGLLLDGASLRVDYHTAVTRALTTVDRSEGIEAGIGYRRTPAVRDLDLTPGPVEAVLRALVPRALEETEAFDRLASARLRWSPASVAFTGTYRNLDARSYRYASILAAPEDAAVRPVEAPREGLETTTRITFRPLASLLAGATLASTRDLLPTARAGADDDGREAIGRARAELAGVDLGWERRRNLTTFLDFRPPIADWLRPGIGYTARYRADRSPSYVEGVAAGADTMAVLQRAFDGDRQLTRSLVVDLPALVGEGGGGEADPSRPRSPGGAGRAPGPLRRVLGALGRAIGPIDLNWVDAIASRFDWRAVDPALDYQLGLGDFDAFHVIDGDTAASVVRRASFRARTELRLPLGTRIDVAYEESESAVHELRGGRRSSRDRSWPDVALRWAELPLPDFLRGAVAHGSFTAGYRESTRSSIFGGTDGQEWAGTERSIPIQLAVAFANGLSGTYTGQLADGTGRDPTGRTEYDGAMHTVQVAGSFVAPAALRESFPAPINASLRWAYQARSQCRLVAGTDADTACIPFVDYIDKEFSLTLDTILSQLTMGFQMSYTDRQSYVGARNGSSQFQLGLFGEFNFTAGTFAAGGAR
ncbi:MAG TPA: hypothetical protein VF158_14075 [Longimicrobiales bacterium]